MSLTVRQAHQLCPCGAAAVLRGAVSEAVAAAGLAQNMVAADKSSPDAK